MTIQLHRTERKGKAVYGTLGFILNGEQYIFGTMENADYIIPAGRYPLKMTWSPKFKKNMPEICDVPEIDDSQVVGDPDTNQQSVCGGESRGRSCSDDLTERYRPSQSPCRMRQGIRVHCGTAPEHSLGCVLFYEGKQIDRVMALETLKAFINFNDKYNEEDLFIEIID